MIVKAAITAIGAQGDGGHLCRRDGVRFTGVALFLAADAEAGAHGVDLAACGEAGKTPFPPCRAATGRGTVRRMGEGPVGLGADANEKIQCRDVN